MDGEGKPASKPLEFQRESVCCGQSPGPAGVSFSSLVLPDDNASGERGKNPITSKNPPGMAGREGDPLV
jgi:hypothetical protein